MEHKIVVAALYQFAKLDDYIAIQPELLRVCQENKIKGTLLLAAEGINGTIAGTRAGIDAVKTYIATIPQLNSLEYKESSASKMPFFRLKVRLKKEIVTLGVPDVSPTKVVGTYVTPQEWNDIISDPETVVIDVRNDYEVKIGSFKNAIDPHTKTFREFPAYVHQNLDPKKHKKVAMFCTGGIRCEKASSFMMMEGYENVYHLHGGILKYLEEIPAEKSLWDGDCFVFDQRVAITHGLEEGKHKLCFCCRHPLSEDDLLSTHYREGVECPHCYDNIDEKTRKSALERQKQIKLARARNQEHLGARY